MIYDKIKNANLYYGISDNLDKALHFMMEQDLAKLPMGKTVIDEDRVFINVMEAVTKAEEETAYEIHKKYMDIQIDLEGTEQIYIGKDATKEVQIFDESIDFGTVQCTKKCNCVMGEGNFIVCMAEEPHMPGVFFEEKTNIKKCVIKVAV